jgi:glycogen operon protein
MENLNLLPGQPWPLGAHSDGQGVNFAVFSAHAQAMELCLFDESGTVQTAKLPFVERTHDVWHGYLPNAKPGLIYGLRAFGPLSPEQGHRFDASKVLLDPYARDIVSPQLLARVTHDRFDWEDDKAPNTALSRSVLYECHVKGFSKLNEAIPQELRGTYLGIAHPASIAHLKRLGITAVSLLPVQYSLTEQRLSAMGLSNYWGYNTLGFFCADPRLARGAQGMNPRDEFRAMVKTLHREGLEVLLDVVFNHSAESDENGPTLSFRGLDNASYYRLQVDSKSLYENHSGCGNTLDIRSPHVLQLVMDSLRYWVSDMHVDGFRFDLATALGRGDTGFDRDGAFFTAVAQDPVLSRVKMIAEPWDIGPGGYQVGGFPNGWLEWNDQFRDTVRSFWIQSAASSPQSSSNGATRGTFSMRLCGSSDIYQTHQRSPAESVNYVVSHDGFTLRDLVSYNQRHNEANGENNRDGHGHNLSFNCGAEGPSVDPTVNALRSRLQRVLLATTLLSQGTPMLCAGDELGHSQGGNNNPYCQDNATTWIDWSQADADLTAFTAHVVALRHTLQPFHPQWLTGVPDQNGLRDVAWTNQDGTVLHDQAWHDSTQRTLACLIGKPGKSHSPLLMAFNASDTEQTFSLPAGQWLGALDTSQVRGATDWCGQGALPVPAHSLVLLTAVD